MAGDFRTRQALGQPLNARDAAAFEQFPTSNTIGQDFSQFGQNFQRDAGLLLEKLFGFGRGPTGGDQQRIDAAGPPVGIQQIIPSLEETLLGPADTVLNDIGPGRGFELAGPSEVVSQGNRPLPTDGVTTTPVAPTSPLDVGGGRAGALSPGAQAVNPLQDFLGEIAPGITPTSPEKGGLQRPTGLEGPIPGLLELLIEQLLSPRTGPGGQVQ